MKIIGDILYIEWQELIGCGIAENTLKSAKLRKSNSWSFMDDPEDKRRVLVEYEKLGVSYKEKVKAKYGNPYHFVARQPIRNMIQWDDKAENFFLGHKYAGNKKLSPEHVEKYTKAANWLNMLRETTNDKKTLKNLLKLTIDDFYNHVIELIKTENIDLPTTYRRLLAKRKEYEAGGYGTLIDWRFGNNLAAKVKDELAESILLEMLAHPNQYDDVFICGQYNLWAKSANYRTINAATVGVHRRKNEHDLIMFREGNAALNGKFLKQAKGQRPSTPLYFVENDDNHLDLLFQDPDNKQGVRRYIAMVVTDSYNDYVLGYAYAPLGSLKEGQTIDLVKAAYINAMYYVKSLTGGWYLPHETKSDRWAIKSLMPFYEGMGKHINATLGNSRRGYIEQFFGTAHWKRCIKAGANNYSGNNITAKSRGVNMEALKDNKKARPMIGDEAEEKIEQFFHRLRHMPQSNGISKHKQWMDAWEKTASDNKRPISDEQFLLKFGIEHNHLGQGIKITNRGVEPQINGIKYSYDLQEYHLDHIGKTISLLYDPYDMSRVLVTDFESIRLIGTEARLNTRALKDAQVDSRLYLNSILDEKRTQVKDVMAASQQRKKVIEDAYIDAEAVLLEGMAVKEINQYSEVVVLNALVEGRENPEDFLINQM